MSLVIPASRSEASALLQTLLAAHAGAKNGLLSLWRWALNAINDTVITTNDEQPPALDGSHDADSNAEDSDDDDADDDDAQLRQELAQLKERYAELEGFADKLMEPRTFKLHSLFHSDSSSSSRTHCTCYYPDACRCYRCYRYCYSLHAPCPLSNCHCHSTRHSHRIPHDASLASFS
jgi:hypothetical protein